MVLPTPSLHAQRFQPVIFSDEGTNLYPLCDSMDETMPKALVPVMNRPMIAFPLQWLVSAGFRTCLLVAPVAQHAAFYDALRSLYLVPSSSDREAEQAEQQAAFEQEAESRYARLLQTGRSIPWADMRRYLQERAEGGQGKRPAARKLAR